MSDITGFLYAEPSFLSGVGRVIDLGGTMTDYNISPHPAVADALAQRADLAALTSDTVEAMRQLADQIEAQAS